MVPIKVGIIGYGWSAKCFHLPFILPNPNLEVYAFLQRKEAPSEKSGIEAGVHCTVDYPKSKHYRTADAFFADSEIDLAIICTAHDTHYELAEQALLAGKHVVVEKPFTLTSAEADHLIALAKKQNKILTVYQNRRYDSDFRTLRHLVSLNAFGKITEFENHYDIDNPDFIHKCTSTNPPQETGEGMLYAIGTHSIDQCLLLFGTPKSVTAVTRVLRGGEGVAEDAFTIVLQYAGELVVTVKTTIVCPAPVSRLLKYSVRGTRGMFVKTGEDPQISHLSSGLHPTDPQFGVEPASYHGYLSTTTPLHASTLPDSGLQDTKLTKGDEPFLKFNGTVPSQRGSYRDYYIDVVAAIRGEKGVVVRPEESRDGIRVIELARESAEKGLTVAWS